VQFPRQQRYSEVSVNVTPLIDVVFLLLIFFMVSTTFTKESHLTLELPEADGEQQLEQIESVEIVISAKGQYVVNGQTLVNNRLDTLKKALKEVSVGDTSLPMIITADAKTEHQLVIRAMDAAGQMGFAHLSLTTQQPQ
jgi:biopolymer transport protein ExbD